MKHRPNVEPAVVAGEPDCGANGLTSVTAAGPRLRGASETAYFSSLLAGIGQEVPLSVPVLRMSAPASVDKGCPGANRPYSPSTADR
jgi:hypothetical protein